MQKFVIKERLKQKERYEINRREGERKMDRNEVRRHKRREGGANLLFLL